MTPETDRIEAEIRGCKTVREVIDCYNHHKPRLLILSKKSDIMRGRCNILRNLRNRQIELIKEGGNG